MDKVLVTGADGFIGSHLVEMLLRAGKDVRAFVHYSSREAFQNLCFLPDDLKRHFEVVKGDIADPFSVDNAVRGCDQVFHLAALIGIPYSYVAPASYLNTNVTGTLNILEAARKNSVQRVLHTSTSETYGSAQYVPMDEKHPLVGQSPYSASKIAADKLAESFHLSFDLPVTTVRPFNTYGPRQSSRAIIPTIVVQALTLGELSLGNLEPVRDLTFVTDTAAGFVEASKSDDVIGQVVNLGTGDGVSVRTLVEKIGNILGQDLRVNMDPKRVRPEGSEVDRLISDNSKVLSLTNWEPRVSLDDGLSHTVEFIKENIDRFQVAGYSV